MARSRSHKDDEDFRGKIRELEKINKALRKRLRQLEKSKHIWTQFKLDEDEETTVEPSKELACSSCGKGTLLHLDLGRIGQYWICSTCDHRQVIKNG